MILNLSRRTISKLGRLLALPFSLALLISQPSWADRDTNLPKSFEVDPTEIQKALAQAGFYDAAIDGIIGPKTRRAIREFQKSNQLRVDGICGVRTWTKLKSYLDEDSPGALTPIAPSEAPAPDIKPEAIILPPEPELSAQDLKRKLVP